MRKMEHQHGDLILEIVNCLPATAKPVENFDGIVLKGEGVNTHEVNPADVEMYFDGPTMYLQPKRKTQLKHQEHGVQVLEKEKVYRRIIEREYDYESQEERQTRD